MLLTVSIYQWRLLPGAVNDSLTVLQKGLHFSEDVHEVPLLIVYSYWNKTPDNTFKKHISTVLQPCPFKLWKSSWLDNKSICSILLWKLNSVFHMPKIKTLFLCHSRELTTLFTEKVHSPSHSQNTTNCFTFLQFLWFKGQAEVTNSIVVFAWFSFLYKQKGGGKQKYYHEVKSQTKLKDRLKEFIFYFMSIP